MVRKGLCEEVTFGLTPEFQEDVIHMELGSRARQRLEQVPRPHSGTAAVCVGGAGGQGAGGKGPQPVACREGCGPTEFKLLQLELGNHSVCLNTAAWGLSGGRTLRSFGGCWSRPGKRVAGGPEAGGVGKSPEGFCR